MDEYGSKARTLSLRKPGGSRVSSFFGLSTQRKRGRLVFRCAVTLLLLLGAFFILDIFDDEDDDLTTAASRAAHRGSASHRPHLPKHTRKTDFLEDWLRFRAFHPYNATDRLSFAEMGFQTAVYEQAIRSVDALGEDRLEEIEKMLYPWMRDLDIIRKKQVRRHTEDKHHRPTNPGIVIVAGNGQFRYAVELINTIRKGHRCDIPIEVYFHGIADLNLERQEFLLDNFEGVRVVDLSRVGYFDETFVSLQHGFWAMKPFAMMATDFTEVMLLDADSILLADPHDFFHQPDYRKTGTLFFQDRLMPDVLFGDLQSWLKTQLGEREPSATLQGSPFWEKGLRHRGESGLVLLNKADPGVFATLLFILWQNSGEVRSAMTYVLFYGDKETFWSAFELAGMPYYMSPYWAGAIGPEHARHLDGFCSDHILHFFDAPVVHNASASIGAGDHRHHAQGASLDAGHSAATDSDGVLVGRPAWLNGALRNNKIFDAEDGVMDYTKSIWTMDGKWQWRDVPSTGGQSICKSDYTRHSMDELSMGPVMPAILQAGQEALEMILTYFESDY